MTPIEIILMLVGVFLALSTMSYIFIGENKAFNLSESIIIGGQASLGVFAIISSLRSALSGGKSLIFIPILIGLLTYTRMTKYRWAARYPIAILSGVGLGVVTGATIRGQIIAMAQKTMVDLVAAEPDIISAVISMIGVSCVTLYFTYSAKYSDPIHKGTFGFIARLGRIFLYAGFGYLYAATFMNEGIDAMSGQIMSIIVRSIRALQGYYG